MTTTHREYTNVTPRQIEVLTFLSKRDHWSVGQVATALDISSAAATKAIVRLEKKGLVTRSTDMMDRRCVHVRLTRVGNDVIHQSAKLV